MSNTNGNTQANSYSPSVPISIYRELAGELQSTQGQLNSLYEENQRLMQQNQQLRHEIDKVLQSTQHLQNVVQYFDENDPNRTTVGNLPQSGEQATIQVANPPSFMPQQPTPDSNILIAEVKEDPSGRTSSGKHPEEKSGWLTIVIIVLFILTAFATGFVLVRPLLTNNNN